MKEIIIKKILPNVLKPARYTGGEYHQAKMKKDAKIRFTLAFPDTYEVGMSHLGMKIIYGLLNELPQVNCERVFAPLSDMEEQLRKYDIPLYSLESFSPLRESDIVGFSIQYEMCLTNVLLMLDLSQIPFLSIDRTEDDPIIIAGGPCCVNPEPFCEIFDLIVIGESEELLPVLMNVYETSVSRTEFLKLAAELEGVYVPSFYDVTFDNVTHQTTRVASPPAKDVIKRQYITDMNTAYYPKKVIVPFIEPVHDRVIQEVMRGCPRGCRFCQAGFIYRPVRQKNIATVNKQADYLLESTGFEEISFASLSTTDYKGCQEVIRNIIDKHNDDKVTVSLPSLRIDQFSLDLVKEIQKARLGALTFAPEAGSQRMRDIINKNVTEEDILSTLKSAFLSGYIKIKLYFMIGLPHETEEDVAAIGALIDKILDMYYSLGRKGRFPTISVSVSCYVPKPFTPFQFYGQDSVEQFKEKQRILQKTVSRKVKLNYHDATLSVLESAFARGDRKLNQVLIKAYENGCRFDSWPEHFNESGWENAFSHFGLDYEDIAKQTFDYEDNLPWDFIDIGVTKEFLIRESEKSKQAQTSKNCYEQCENCGISIENGRCDFEI